MDERIQKNALADLTLIKSMLGATHQGMGLSGLYFIFLGCISLLMSGFGYLDYYRHIQRVEAAGDISHNHSAWTALLYADIHDPMRTYGMFLIFGLILFCLIIFSTYLLYAYLRSQRRELRPYFSLRGFRPQSIEIVLVFILMAVSFVAIFQFHLMARNISATSVLFLNMGLVFYFMGISWSSQLRFAGFYYFFATLLLFRFGVEVPTLPAILFGVGYIVSGILMRREWRRLQAV